MGLLGAKSIVNKLWQLQWGTAAWPPRLLASLRDTQGLPHPAGGRTPARPCPPPPGRPGLLRGPQRRLRAEPGLLWAA